MCAILDSFCSTHRDFHHFWFGNGILQVHDYPVSVCHPCEHWTVATDSSDTFDRDWGVKVRIWSDMVVYVFMIFVLPSLMFYYFYIGAIMGDFAVIFQFCKGETPYMAHMVWLHNSEMDSEDQVTAKFYYYLLTLLSLVFVITELTLYLGTFRYINSN